MTIIACPDCHRGVSARAAACPHCGAPIAIADGARLTHPAKEPVGRLLAVMAFLLVFVGYWSIIRPRNAGGGRTDDARWSTETAPTRRRIERPAPVFRSEQAMNDAVALVNTGTTDPVALAPYTACIASAGSELTVLESGVMRARVQVTAGPAAGCTGWVPAEFTR